MKYVFFLFWIKKCLFRSNFVLNLHALRGIGPWCNGNTPVFGTVILGSSPSGPTNKIIES